MSLKISYGRGDLTESGFSYQSQGNSYQNYFESAPGDFASLTQSIATNIGKIQLNVEDLQRIVIQQKDGQNSSQRRDKFYLLRHSTSQLSNETANLLKVVKEYPLANLAAEQRHRKLQIERLVKSFSDVLASFQSIQREAANIEKRRFTNVNSSGDASMSSDLIDLTSQQQQRQLTSPPKELLELEEREQALRQIEADIENVNHIFAKLGTMVHDQQNKIDSIAANIDHAEADVETGNLNVFSARKKKESSRKWKMIGAFIGTVIITILLVALFV